MFTRIQWRIAASYVGLIGLVLGGLGIYLVEFQRAQQLSELEAQLQRQARLVADNAQYRLATEGAASLDSLAKQLGGDIGVRITLIAANGAVLGDSDHDPTTMENHGTRPEVLQALQQGSGRSQRHSATLNRGLLYLAVPIERTGTILGVARVALPVPEVQGALNRVTAAIATAFAIAALLAVALAMVVARVTAGPIRALTQEARRLAAGEPEQTIPVRGRDEVSVLAHTFNDMAVKLRRHIRAVEDERGRLNAVVSHMADGLVITDQEGTVLLINPAAARLLQLAPGWAEGRSVMAVVRDHELAAAVGEALAGDAAAGRPRPVELGPSGQRRTVQALASRIPSGDGTNQQVLLLLHDVTELRRAETVRREFVANVSHELRTPVASLKALVETLEDGALDETEAARDFLSRMHIEVDGLAQLLEQLLELSRIESGQVALHMQPAHLDHLVEAVVERLRPLAERQGVSFTVSLPDELPTPPGGRITVSAERRGGEVAVVVADTGVGVAPEALPRLFERFYMADKARARGGSGLGLAIAKHVVQAHGGRIWAESAGEGQGATLTFTLPLAGASTNP